MAAVLIVRLQTCTAFAPAAARAASRAHVTTSLLQRRHGHSAMRRWHTRSFHVSAVAEVQEDAALCGPPSILDGKLCAFWQQEITLACEILQSKLGL
jgi:hypothetical protein